MTVCCTSTAVPLPLPHLDRNFRTRADRTDYGSFGHSAPREPHIIPTISSQSSPSMPLGLVAFPDMRPSLSRHRPRSSHPAAAPIPQQQADTSNIPMPVPSQLQTEVTRVPPPGLSRGSSPLYGTMMTTRPLSGCVGRALPSGCCQTCARQASTCSAVPVHWVGVASLFDPPTSTRVKARATCCGTTCTTPTVNTPMRSLACSLCMVA